MGPADATGATEALIAVPSATGARIRDIVRQPEDDPALVAEVVEQQLRLVIRHQDVRHRVRALLGPDEPHAEGSGQGGA